MQASSDTFAELLTRARQGAPDAIDMLLQRHLHTVRAFVRLRSGRMLRTMESHSDLVQSVCREVLGDLGDFASNDEPAFKQWLLTVAHHKILAKVDYHNAKKRQASKRVGLDGMLAAYGTFCSPSRQAAVREEIERIESAFDRLPEDYREVITLACLVGLPHRDVAAKLGKNEPAVRQMLARARARLALLLE